MDSNGRQSGSKTVRKWFGKVSREESDRECETPPSDVYSKKAKQFQVPGNLVDVSVKLLGDKSR